MSRIEIPEGSPFGVENLPYGVFSVHGGQPRVGVRVGDSVVDLFVLLGDDVFDRPTLDPFMAQGPSDGKSFAGRDPVRVEGEDPTFLLDGDEVTITATAAGPGGTRIGFGGVSGRIRPATEPGLPGAEQVPACSRRSPRRCTASTRSSALGGDGPAPAGPLALTESMQRFVLDNLAHPGLSVEVVARRAGCRPAT
ncbi:MAG: hypothetical protein J0I34_00100 [Pseudonocardia sp.]|uniref:hypothetical protein n=1 Tax=unclassified Pseudonocardia TaxID=2619320 RepID=UPI00086C6FF9|nr:MULTISPECIES: hypothetical protein [unclassified Pseudonocardia]MBN9107157.1 hypothetical protein [Pseudonocardia sp.]ODU26360.1 MAG: hypothetical protein ABS80_07325 [Pseudonocardia sp. SCN 72-51]ODV02696.1 MAG: hypothetical protein ABT15_24750 [Pseudonocardia sp. SCN 73-27]